MSLKRKPRCRWCSKRLDKGAHREVSENLCYVRNEKAIRSRLRPRVKKLSEVYENGKIRPEFIGTDMEDKLMQRQRELALNASLGLGDNGYHMPKNVDVFIQGGFVWNQVAQQRPWAVYILVKTKQGVKRKRKRFNNLYDAIRFHKKVRTRFPSSGIVSLGQSYDIPAQLRLTKEKWPKRFKWCPRCAAPRVFKIAEPRQQFSSLKKRWSHDKGRYEWVERKLWLTECQLCGCTNRNEVMRRANLPYEVRRIKPGVRRVRPRDGAPRRKRKTLA